MEKEIIYIIIAILLLVILVNLNVKETFSDMFNTTYNTINLNETKQTIIDNIAIYKTNYLSDFNSIFDSSLNVVTDNIYGDNSIHNFTSAHIDSTTGTNQIVDINRFDNYTYAYRTQPKGTNFPTVPGMIMKVNHKISVKQSPSYIAITHIIEKTQLIINYMKDIGIFTNYSNNAVLTNETYSQEDIDDYKMILLTNLAVKGLLDQYDTLELELITTGDNVYYTDTSGANLITKHEAIIQTIRGILFQIPILFFVCLPYFNNTAGSDILSNISQLNMNTMDGYNNRNNVFKTVLDSIVSSTFTAPYNNLF